METTAFAELNPEYDAEHRLLVLSLEHGKANEMGTAQLEAFDRLCQQLETDDEVMCMCTLSRRVSARGRPLFIAGANVTERQGWSDERIKAHVISQRNLMERIRRLPLFTVAVTHGVTFGWGVEYLLSQDYTVATGQATFALPETGLGIIPGARGTAELAAIVGIGHAMRLGCVGETINAQEAWRIGLIQELADDVDQAMDRVKALATQLQRRSPTAIASFKRAMLDGRGQATDQRIALESAAYERCVDIGDAAIGRQSFAEIREGKTPQWGRRKI